jgi:hypothetical protein
MSDVFVELDEAIRQERVERFFKEHGKFVLGLVALTVLATGLISGFRAWNNSVRADQTSSLIALLDAEDFPDNILAAEPDLRGGLKGVALLTAAGEFLDQEKQAEALELYERAAADRAVPADLRQLATLMSVRLQATGESADTDAMLKKLEAVARNNNSPWQAHARLESAVLYAHGKQDYKAARIQLALVTKMADLPETLRQRAEALDHVYALKQNELQQKEKQDQGT